MDNKRLTIVIPALNEEEAIGGTIARCLDAREEISHQAGLDGVEIIVVSDGSTDRTVEIAQSYEDVQVVVFEENQGYGAAIKEGWRLGQGDLVGFLDADGTCDPRFFAQLCRTALDENADVTLGSRLGSDSQMPLIRRAGNRIFAFLLGLLCGRKVTDTASGMRVVRRQSLKHLYPLPDGLHFTPAMSARALMNHLRIIEIPMKYEERIGESKLSALWDGFRFLKVIGEGVLCYRPEKIFLAGFTFCVLLILLLAAYPAEFYFQHGRLEEWMIYRFVVCQLVGSFGMMLLLASALTNRMAQLSSRREESVGFWSSIVVSLFSGKSLLFITGLFTLLGIGFLWPGIVEYVTTGTITLHWSRLIAGAFALFTVMQTLIFFVLMKVVAIWYFEQSVLKKNILEAMSNESSELRNVNYQKITPTVETSRHIMK
ncbi:Undecaprenyl-phosphate 4-deoxy-4-formamido-L-arabinose transferase [Gimesia alba]|uniref:Undecaprenyl-phosphate 4-deoxy-4-formamido-L-arabinose transferase n=1 Tax=Gimesia alba TaxID=2527973 RepID=A0A517RJ73_9PLAN|nr:glycosyltransferase family 2 protein [Gimesia alba]QDT43921.1 Undecaprenyl-phosphate 4-deoxy-4-formamido-L-arabinose transferase [Gimesia alba]